MVTMKEVAQQAGVSESTVSHVINNTRPVSEERRSRVLLAMRELGFSANAHARGSARGRSNFLGLLVSDIENPFFPGVIKSFEDVARQHGFDVLLFSTNYDSKIAERACQKLVENQAPAVAVMTSQVDAALLEYLSANGVSSVMLDGAKVAHHRSSLHLRYEKGAVEGVQCLFNLGHRDMAMIAGPQDRRSHIAYRSAVESAAWALNCRLRVMEGRNTAESGSDAVRELLTSKDLPTAVLCSNDLTAIGVIRTLAQSGLRVPEDVSVVGADDIPLSQLMTPPLTTVHIPRQELGRIAFAVIQRMLASESSEGTESSLDTHLIVRGSTGANRKAETLGG
jgi:DNA-binding LacI/PurR family transcriptional regulator